MADYKLSSEQFTDAVSKGLGRAMMHIKRHGLDDVADILLDVCIHSKIWDTQCEKHRSDWLYSMFANSPQYDDFRDAILSALNKENEWHETVQLCELTEEMALDGDGYARAALSDFVLRSAAVPGERDYFGVQEYINVHGNDAVPELAKIYGQRLMDDPEDSVKDSLSYENEDRRAFAQLLEEHSSSDPRIRVYFDYLNNNGGLDPSEVLSDAETAVRQEIRKREFLSQYDVERIINCAKEGCEENGSIYRRFGAHGDSEDLEVIFAQLLNEKDDAVRKRLLWVFDRNPLPVIDGCFFEWADNKDEKLRAAVFLALANCKDDRVHEFARQRVKAGKIIGWANSFVLDLFVENFGDGDAKLIFEVILKSKPSKDDIHRFGLSISSIAEGNRTKDMKDMLLWVYENTPCSMCRERAVKRLDEIEELSQEIIDECLWDGCEDIREFARDLAKQ